MQDEILNIRQKSDFWQYVRGLCILACIMIHCPSGATYEVGSFEFTFWLILRQLINFPVATFIFMSGYFTNVEKYQNKPKAYVYTRFVRLIIPYLIWSVFYITIDLARTLHSGGNVEWLKIFYKLLIGKASTPFYYIIVLLQLTLLTPILIKIILKNDFTSKLLWILTPIYLIYLYLYNIISGNVPKIYETGFPAWFVFYYLGLQINMNKTFASKCKDICKKRYVFAMLIFSVVEAFLLIFIGCSSAFASSQIKVSSFLYSFVLILWLCTKSDNYVKCKTKWIKSVGDYSYGMYYVHCFILMLFAKVSSLFNLNGIWFLNFLITWLSVSIISFLVVWFANKITGNSQNGKKILSWIGFR